MTIEAAPRRTEYLPLDHITPDPANPKAHDLTVIDASVGRFGMIDQIVRDDRTGYIISGHGRHEALRVMRDRGDNPPEGVRVDAGGHWLIPVIVGWASRTDSEARAALIALNRTTELGGWVDDALLDLLDNLDDYTGVGFDEDDLDDLRDRLDELSTSDVTQADHTDHADAGSPSQDGDSERAQIVLSVKDLPGVEEHVTLHHGDCLDVMRQLPDESVDSIVTDPPYGLGFMGKDWDDLPPGEEWAKECLRVLKPGGHLLAFGGTRTWHRLAVAVEDAGFEIRDSIAWLYGQGFPKSLDVSKAIDKEAGAERNDVYADNVGVTTNTAYGSGLGVKLVERRPVTPDAEQWNGWGTALKPAFEPIVVGRKPIRGTVAANVLAHGTGALNIDGCRVEVSGADRESWKRLAGFNNTPRTTGATYANGAVGTVDDRSEFDTQGRWPANVVLDESQAAALDEQSGTLTSGGGDRRGAKDAGIYGAFDAGETARVYESDTGGASRFFPTFRYEAKAPTSERPRLGEVAHPTVKPLDLMRWLVRLVTPPGGVVLEPFAGSGTTLEAAVLEGFDVIGIEREADYMPLIRQRLGMAEPGEVVEEE